MERKTTIGIEPVYNAYIINDEGLKEAAWYCKNENKWRNIDMQLGKYIRAMVVEMQEEQPQYGEGEA